ncbi:MAG: protein kinase, partial [Planctomycetota bacterium]
LDSLSLRYPRFAEALAVASRAERPPNVGPLDSSWSRWKAYYESQLHSRPLSGTIGPYELHGVLGEGGFGVVYRAFDTRNSSIVALKTLRFLSADPLMRLKREFRAMADVVHPNVVRLIELSIVDGQCFFTMELAEGTNFLSYVRKQGSTAGGRSLTQVGGSLSTAAIEKLRSGLRQTVEGLRTLHEAGIVHRDIKPSNVLVTKDERVVLLDFGLVAELSSRGSHRSLGVVGTPAYMSPEQAEGEAIGAAADWYSLGAMTYQALTGQTPFTGTYLEMIHDKKTKIPPRPSAHAEVPPELDELVVRLLERDPKKRPEAEEILEYLDATPATTESKPQVASASKTFVGRTAELSALDKSLERVHSRHNATTELVGRSGIGKSALARKFLTTRCGSDEYLVLAGRCYEQESLPYKGFDALIDELTNFCSELGDEQVEPLLPRDTAELSLLFPVLRRLRALRDRDRGTLETPDQQELRRRAFAALRELFVRLADRWTLVVYIDDLQWADSDTLRLLFELLVPPHPPKALFLLGYRSEDLPSSGPLQELREWLDDHSEISQCRLEITELAADEVRELTRTIVETPTAGLDDVVFAESKGHPYFASELARSIHERADSEKDLAPLSLDEMIWERSRRLSDRARAALETVAIAGHPLTVDIVCDVAKISEDPWAPLGELRSHNFVRSANVSGADALETYHDRVREVVNARVPEAAKRRYHSELADALEAENIDDPELLGRHRRDAGDKIHAASYFETAARRAEDAFAFDHAASLYAETIQLGRKHGTDGTDLALKQADALANAGRGPDAARCYLAAARGDTTLDQLEIRRRAANQWLISGHVQEGLHILRTVLSDSGLRLPATPFLSLVSLLKQRAVFWFRGMQFDAKDEAAIEPRKLFLSDLCWTVSQGLSPIDTIRAADFQTRALLYALKSGETKRIARGLAWTGVIESTGGPKSHQRVIRLLDRAKALSEQVSAPEARGFIEFSFGMKEYLSGNFPRAYEHYSAAQEVFRTRCSGVTWELDNAESWGLWSLLYMGEFRRMADDCHRFLADARRRGDLYAIAMLKAYTECVAHLIDDAPEKAEEAVSDQGARLAQPHGLAASAGFYPWPQQP